MRADEGAKRNRFQDNYEGEDETLASFRAGVREPFYKLRRAGEINLICFQRQSESPI
jgi:hypothetical protein